MTGYNGPNVYRVVDVHPAVSIEFSGEELEFLLQAAYILRSSSLGLGSFIDKQVAEDVTSRLQMARTAMRTKFARIEGERKVYAE